MVLGYFCNSFPNPQLQCSYMLRSKPLFYNRQNTLASLFMVKIIWNLRYNINKIVTNSTENRDNNQLIRSPKLFLKSLIWNEDYFLLHWPLPGFLDSHTQHTPGSQDGHRTQWGKITYFRNLKFLHKGWAYRINTDLKTNQRELRYRVSALNIFHNRE